MTRYVKLGRRPLNTFGACDHWAVKVGYCWYELEGAAENDFDQSTRIFASVGSVAKSGAGSFGGETVGETNKTDQEIRRFNEDWLESNQTYRVKERHSQKYAIDFIRWLTNNKYRIRHQPDAQNVVDHLVDNSIACTNDGQAFASAHVAKIHEQHGIFGIKGTALAVDAEAIAGPGFGAWANATIVKAEVNAGPFGVHAGLNADTGAGIRGGNLDAHLLGFGGKVGADGIAVDTPVGGVKVPNPITLAADGIGWLFKK